MPDTRPALMLARSVTELPTDAGWAFEPKLDGWRIAVMINMDGVVRLRSRRGRALEPYFPDIVAAASSLPSGVFLDGELVISTEAGLDFAALQARIHPSPKRVAELARRDPAGLVAFDLLELGGRDLRPEPYDARRAALLELLADTSPVLAVMPQTTDLGAARAWMANQPPGVEGVVAKRRAQRYRPGARDWRKIRTRATTEAIVGGVIGELTRPEALILGRPTAGGRLRVIGRTGPLPKPARVELGALLSPPDASHPWPDTLPSSRFGQLPGERVAYTKVSPDLVVEIEHDLAHEHDRYRHLTRFLRVCPDLVSEDLRP